MMATRINISMLCIAMALLATGTMANAQTTDEDLREEIRKEVREELQKQEEQKKMEAKKAKMRAEELEREQRTLDEKAKSERNAKRHSGWSISAHVGPNLPLGRLASRDFKTGYFGTVGYAATLNNTIMFGKMVGVHLGLGYDTTPIDGEAWAREHMTQNEWGSDVSLYYDSSPFEQITVRFGPVIRAMGKAAAFHFRPYAGINVITGGQFSYVKYQNAEVDDYRIVYKTTSAFLVGTALDLSIHIGKRSDIVVSTELNMVWRDIFFEQSDSVLGTTVFKSEAGEFIRLSPMIGYRFHL